MKPLSRIVLALAATGMTVAAAAAEQAPAAARFYPLLGKWTGSAEMGEPGKPPAKLAVHWNCRKASAGNAVLCEMSGRNKDMAVHETDLFGVDPVSGQAHWYAVTDMGETHDHKVEWPDPKTMKAAISWTQEGKQMQESVTMRLSGAKALEFQSVVTQDGKEVGSFSGRLKR
ncbi:MAG TPA: hypothetical protein VFV84_07910 [Burkholderiales bacterium]|nr:hypothetical protein [Burkholderiales bacterium]